MNNKLKELAEQSGISFKPFIVDEEEYDFEDVVVSDSDVLEKFAELIIQECKQAAKETYLPVLEDKEMMKCDYWKGYVSGGVDAVCEMKVRFWEDDDE